MGTSQCRVGVGLESGEEVAPVLFDAGEPLVLVEPQVGEDDRTLDPRADLQCVDLRGGLGEEFEADRAVGPSAEQGRYLDPGGAVRLGVLRESGGRVNLGEGSEESDDGGVLDEEVRETGQLGGQSVPRNGAKLCEAVGDTPTEELDEFGVNRS